MRTQQGRAGDALQRPLRSRFQVRLTPGVGWQAIIQRANYTLHRVLYRALPGVPTIAHGGRIDTTTLARELRTSIDHVMIAYTLHARTPQDAIRFWDHQTPYFIHPIWGAMMLFTEAPLPAELRYIGYQVLLWHDNREDTTWPSNARAKEDKRDEPP